VPVPSPVQVLSPDLSVAAGEVAALALDVLVFPELGMDARTYALAYRRMAPVQVRGPAGGRIREGDGPGCVESASYHAVGTVEAW
jgi:hypothetical protein